MTFHEMWENRDHLIKNNVLCIYEYFAYKRNRKIVNTGRKWEIGYIAVVDVNWEFLALPEFDGLNYGNR